MRCLRMLRGRGRGVGRSRFREGLGSVILDLWVFFSCNGT
jgi:hypothetical protein